MIYKYKQFENDLKKSYIEALKGFRKESQKAYKKYKLYLKSEYLRERWEIKNHFSKLYAKYKSKSNFKRRIKL